ncbi:hypothetical protein CPAST_c25830 [Clostridium pasteurianum DSM 525 = ATCC 6013]|uniref:DUF5659 domain-containing protein n=1 Tax=Clostridium pasteurianum DSM 525 = ATCC 6013 TaxID=1262449 RepID=A0A0H3J653_CLOPA|nr:hypothetical protein [Clostridium pasteurianum]AJA48652.1 hypothetical protein CPAST_c25830 [Clostridium pasteurianum DSM 525 = ATCC 6013]AJA52640.1 hypothetical protein CLPA_c25830 [Clostridium pasteurianum DSM 525 = ATCC 6013]AOZ75881.1 hypothetical protein AQ983_12555 [Clostridium pasteurianum DSM 525 = ATCC 6013]AOZ79677.1 hypothetical protein AQ984_12550 [Clostridium pasteurianum]ELP59951.1 hypothetical protein F502_04927 [Clostridium pasteurianum DSM 525 = ATCC 6013]
METTNSKKKYYHVNKKYMADALNFLGCKFYKFTNDDGTVYSFEDNEKFRIALTGLNQLRNQLRKM